MLSGVFFSIKQVNDLVDSFDKSRTAASSSCAPVFIADTNLSDKCVKVD